MFTVYSAVMVCGIFNEGVFRECLFINDTQRRIAAWHEPVGVRVRCASRVIPSELEPRRRLSSTLEDRPGPLDLPALHWRRHFESAAAKHSIRR